MPQCHLMDSFNTTRDTRHLKDDKSVDEEVCAKIIKDIFKRTKMYSKDFEKTHLYILVSLVFRYVIDFNVSTFSIRKNILEDTVFIVVPLA